MQLLVLDGEMQRFGHLFGRLAARAGIGHRQRSRDALRREEEVAALSTQPGVQVERELGIALDNGIQVALGVATVRCCWTGNNRNQGSKYDERQQKLVHGHSPVKRRWETSMSFLRRTKPRARLPV